MRAQEKIKEILALIEELNPDSELLTEDPDIQEKIFSVTNHVMFELARLKKIPVYVEIPVAAGDLLTFDKIKAVCGSAVYQLGCVRGVSYDLRAAGTVLKIRDSGVAEVDCFVYPDRITEANWEDYEFTLSDDALEVLPYGVAADLLKSDASAEYGTIYQKEYENKLQRLDARYSMPGISVEGGVDI